MVRSSILFLITSFIGLGFSESANERRQATAAHTADFEDAPVVIGVYEDLQYTGFTTSSNALKSTSPGLAAVGQLSASALSIDISSSATSFQPTELSFGCAVNIPGFPATPNLCSLNFTPYISVRNPDGSRSLQALADQSETFIPIASVGTNGVKKVVFSSGSIVKLLVTLNDPDNSIALLLAGLGGSTTLTVFIDDFKYVVYA
ncbi:hypothetical protein ABW20_dc0101648 [Dactylellina cionopaga]|nr:hypothetical protein ABW20_dc0101648 [Dactylellina cionopaga]